MYTLYILKNNKNHLYVGVTKNLDKRLERHRSGFGAEFVKRNKTFKIVYTEKFPSHLDARRRETQIKKWRREKKLNLIKFGRPIR